jgi:peptidoglycan hydrolase-like protein with peptidoglycan-binding domain
MFFNVDSSVGNNGTNSNRADILLVQFLIRKLSVLAASNLSPDQRARMGRVTVDGMSGPITIDGIRAVQERMREKQPGTVVDGRVSGARGRHQYGAGVWTIVSLNSSLRKRIPSVWPRLQDLPDCPAALKIEIQKCM